MSPTSLARVLCFPLAEVQVRTLGTGGAALVLAHLSVSDSVDQVTAARGRGVDVYAETCPHYLVLDESRLEGPIDEAAAFMSSPPVRSRAEAEAMTELVRSGAIHLVTSDHSPYTAEQKLPGGAATRFTEVANGVPGVAARIALLRTALGPDSWPTVVERTSAAPARLAGAHPRKGTLQVGSDADLVIWSEAARTLTAADTHDAVGSTPYDGMEVAAWPAVVASAGRILMANGEDGTVAGSGRFIARQA